MLCKSLVSHQLKSALIIVALFALSVAIRMPYMNRPLGSHLEDLTAHTLRIQQIWHEGGALKYKFLPIKTYNNPADRHINNSARIMDHEGNYYYTSYGPLGHMAPYLIFKALGVYPDVKPLRIFGLWLHFFCCLLVYLIIFALTRKDYRGRVNIAALMGFSVYLFSPVALWFHSNVYSSEILVQGFFIAGIYLFLKLMTSSHKGPYYGLLGLSFFLMILTEWLGVLFSLVLLLHCLLNFRKRSMRNVFWVVGLSSFAAIAVIVWHYSQIDGIQRLIRAWSWKFLMSANITSNNVEGMSCWDFRVWRTIGRHYMAGYGWFLINLLYVYLVKKCFLEKDRGGKVEGVMLSLCFWPMFTHELLFPRWTAIHDFSVLKAGFFIAILTAVIYSKIDRYLFQKWGSGFSKALRTQGLLVAFCFITLLSMGSYLSFNKRRVDRFEVIGKKIARIADKQEAIFLRRDPTSKFISPLIVFYAHRNINVWKDDQFAMRFLKVNKVKRGVLLAFDGRGRLVREKHINVDEGEA